MTVQKPNWFEIGLIIWRRNVKADHYARIQELARRFEEKHGTIICREMLGLSVRHDVPVPEARTSEYYKKRPCAEIIGDAAEILEQYITENPVS